MKPGRLLVLALLTIVPFAASGCGSRSVSVPASDPNHEGAQIFSQSCAGCHTLDAAGTQGSAVTIRNRERVDGPNFNTRKEEVDQVLYAIRNGGFSGAIMPENIVVGDDAQKVAEFLAKYSGAEAKAAKEGDNETNTGQGQGGS
ncbi:MAG: c-type cytochrome [Solirubrobacteraceae bacterium]